MCGIVGYTGKRNAVKVVIGGLEKLEYRGYDSAGIAVLNEGKISVEKYKGRLAVLEKHLKENKLFGNTAIGHTRWASHGEPSDLNAHPHTSNDGLITLVHNGIIENYAILKEELLEKGYEFKTETDTESVVHLIHSLYKGDILEAVIDAVAKIKGAYSLCVMCAKEPGRIIAARKESPLIVGIGEGENFVASDIPAVLEYTRDVYLLDDDTFCDVTPEYAKVYDCNKKLLQKETYHVNWDIDAAAKGDYPHFMLKEIYEQPKALENTLRGRLSADSDDVYFENFNIDKAALDSINRICIVACGTAYYAGCAGKKILEKYSGIRVDTEIASEYRYTDTYTDDKTLFIAISQSGETADTLASMKLAKKKGAKVLAVTNVVGSSVAREADEVIYTWAGPEIAVASTKAYSTQVLCMYLLALKFGKITGNVSAEELVYLRDNCLRLPEMCDSALENAEVIRELASSFQGCTDAFYIGRGLDASISLEGSLKMKEISYIHAEAYPAGELKHGPIALIDKGTPVIALCTQKGELCEKTLSNIKEVSARGARSIVLAQRSEKELEKEFDKVIYIDNMPNEMTVIPSVVNLQLLAYFVAVANGRDVDKPRNLAKSVTIE